MLDVLPSTGGEGGVDRDMGITWFIVCGCSLDILSVNKMPCQYGAVYTF